MANNNEKNELDDRELDQLLKLASHPKSIANFEFRLLEKIAIDVPGKSVVAFPKRYKTSLWLTAVPLAASLAIGIWLGANDTVPNFLPFGNDDSGLNVASLLSSASSSDDVDNLGEDTQS
jgi:hypothetical protein